MKHRTPISDLAIALAAPLTAAFAPGLDQMPILFCKTSQGCWQGQSHVTPDELRVLPGNQVPASATSQTHTIVYVDGNSDPAVSDIPGSEINRLYGGSDVIADIWLANSAGGGLRRNLLNFLAAQDGLVGGTMKSSPLRFADLVAVRSITLVGGADLNVRFRTIARLPFALAAVAALHLARMP